MSIPEDIPSAFYLLRIPHNSPAPNNLPDIQRSGHREHEASKKNRRSRPLKMSGFAVIEIRKTEFCKEEHRQHKVDNREHHIVHDLLYLRFSGVPCAFDRSGNIPGFGECCNGKRAHHNDGKQRDNQNFHCFLHCKTSIQLVGATCQSS